MFGGKCYAIPLLNLSKRYSTYLSEEFSDDESIHNNSVNDPFTNEIENTDALGEEMQLIRQQMNQKPN